jgi:AraC-like DNA-binding protein
MAAGASKVSQKAASAKPHPGLAIGPVGATPSAAGVTVASEATLPTVPPVPDEASLATEDPPEPSIPPFPPDPAAGSPSDELEDDPHERTHSDAPVAKARWNIEDTITHPSLSPFHPPARTLSKDFTGPMHALFTPLASRVFADLDIGAAVWQPDRWRDIHMRQSLMDFEAEHGIETERFAYNQRCLARARKQRTTVVAHFGGFTDFFVPVCVNQKTRAVLVTGPLTTARSTAADVLARWRSLTGRQGHPADPEFAHYLASTLSTLVLEGKRAPTFQKLLELLANLMATQGPADTIFAQIEALHLELREARRVERHWEIVRVLVDERTSRIWGSPLREEDRSKLGFVRMPEHALVGLFVSRQRDGDPVDELIRRDALQRACVEIAASSDNTASGRIGEHGVSFVCAGRASTQRTRRKLADLADEVSLVARRRFGLGLHFGMSVLPLPLSRQYQLALAAAETALSRGSPMIHAEEDVPAPTPIGRLRQELGRLVDEKPQALPARFDRFLEAVAVRCGYRLEPARAHVEAGFERLAESLLDTGALDTKSFASLYAEAERAALEAGTVSEVFGIYRRALRDIVSAAEKPGPARQDRSLRRAEEYVRQHYTEPLSLRRVARVAGFAPNYFSMLFRRKQRVTFERYLMQLRVERAKQLLSSKASLSMQRVAQLSGFSTGHYFGRVFKRFTRETPRAFHRRVMRGYRRVEAVDQSLNGHTK